MNPMLLAAFDKHVAATHDKQLYLADIVGKLPWQFDMDAGLLSFGDVHRWKVQVLGTYSEQSGTWQWAWANQASSIPQHLLAASNSLRKLGSEKKIAELTQAQVPGDDFSGHFWAILATGLCKAKAYYRGPYEGGAVFLLITDPGYSRTICDPLPRLLRVFPQAISNYEVRDHKHALTGHGQLLGLSVQQVDGVLAIADGQGGSCTARFDAQNRFVEFDAPQISPSVAAEPAIETTRPKKRPDTRRVSVGRKVARFLKLWVHHCRMNFLGATITWMIVALVVGLATWFFTSLTTAATIGAILFAALWLISFIPKDLTTDAQYLARPGWMTVWVATFPTLDALQEYVNSNPSIFADDIAIDRLNAQAIELAAVKRDLESTVRAHARGAISGAALAQGVSNLPGCEYRSVILYHDFDYRGLIAPERINSDAPVALVGTFRYSAE